MNKKLFIGLAVLFFTATSFAATEIYVKASGGSDNYNGDSWNTAYATIGKAIERVQENNTTIIFLEENATFNLIGSLDLLNNKWVSIVGNNTTLKANDKPGKEGGEGSRILRAGGGCNLNLKGINFENGRQVGYYLGGALFFAGDALLVDSCKFLNNEAGSNGGAIGARGREVIIRNSYFEGNYIVGGGSTGGAISSAGKNDVPDCSFVVENCTFYKNDMSYNNGTEGGGSGTAISIYDKMGEYVNLAVMKVINCTFVENTSLYTYQGAIDISSSSTIKAYIINNTFYKNDGALRLDDIDDTKGGNVYMINNLIFAEKAGVLSETTVDELRAPIIGYNNIIVGEERGVNEKMDDECFAEGTKGQYNNTVEIIADYPLSTVALATSLSTDNFVPYLAISEEEATDGVIDAGLDDSSAYTGENLIPEKDIRGRTKKGIRDIGAYEVGGGKSSIFSPKQNIADFFVIIQNNDFITIINTADKELDLNVVDVTGRSIYTAKVANSLNISKKDLNSNLSVFVLSDGVNTKAQKVVVN